MKSEVKMSGSRLQITRVFEAPRAMVFGYWTQLEKLRQWAGCKDATKVEIQADLRPGGSFTQKMQIAGQVTQEGFPDPKLGHIVSQGMKESFEKLDELPAVVQKN
jgi:uncharacterized protein YndB with AHSA1/START domain